MGTNVYILSDAKDQIFSLMAKWKGISVPELGKLIKSMTTTERTAFNEQYNLYQRSLR